MPFVELECTPTVLSSLNLPSKIDEKHPYRYCIRQHTDNNALLISQSHQHNHETFCTELLIVGSHQILVDTKVDCEIVQDAWRYTLRGIHLYADPTDTAAVQSVLLNYLSDILADFRQRNSHTRVSPKAVLELFEPTCRSREAIKCFHWNNA